MLNYDLKCVNLEIHGGHGHGCVDINSILDISLGAKFFSYFFITLRLSILIFKY